MNKEDELIEVIKEDPEEDKKQPVEDRAQKKQPETIIDYFNI